MEIRQVIQLSEKYVCENVPEEYLEDFRVKKQSYANMIMYVAYEKEECLGYALFSPEVYSPYTYVMRFIFAPLEYRGYHIGSNLLKRAEEELIKQKVKVIKTSYPAEDAEDMEPFLSKNKFELGDAETLLTYSKNELEDSLLINQTKGNASIVKNLLTLSDSNEKLAYYLEHEFGLKVDQLPKKTCFAMENGKPVGMITLESRDQVIYVDNLQILGKCNAKLTFLSLLQYAVSDVIANEKAQSLKILLDTKEYADAVRSLLGQAEAEETKIFYKKKLG